MVNYILFISQNLTKRNFERFGVNVMKKKGVNYKILDLSDLFDKKITSISKLHEKLVKDNNYYKFKSFKDLFFFLKRQKNIFFFSNICSYTSFFLSLIERYLISRGNIKVYFSVSVIPVIKRNYFSDFYNMLSSLNILRLLKSLFYNFFKNRLAILLRPLPHIAFVSGDLEKKKFNKEKTTIVDSNSLDHNLFIKFNKKNIKKKYIVFIDQNVFDHPDFKLSNLNETSVVAMSEITYWSKIRLILKKLSLQKKKKVIISLHPKNTDKSYKFIKNFFSKEKNFFIKKKNTLKYIASADTVIAQSSTALQFAILTFKQIFIIKFNNLFKPEKNTINFYLDELRKKKHHNNIPHKEIYKINLNIKNYKRFIRTYICSKDIKYKDISWIRIFDYLKSYKNISR